MQTEALSTELQLVATTMKFMDNVSPAEGVTPPAMVMLKDAWSALQGVSQSAAWQAQPAVVEAMCEVYCASLRATKVHSCELPSAPSLLRGPLLPCKA